MLRVFAKNFKKNWKSGLIPPLIVAIMIPLIASLWPQLEVASEIFKTILQNPAYKAFLGSLGFVDIGKWEGMFYMYLFIWMEMIMLFIVIFFPSRMITTEVDKKTLDMSLSLPIPRWKYLLEKFMVYLTYNLLYPLFILLSAYLSTVSLVGSGNSAGLNYITLTYSVIGVWMWYFALGAISLLCGAIFLESRKANSAAALIVGGMYIIVRIGGMVDSLSWLQYFSVFHYMSAGSIFQLDPTLFAASDFVSAFPHIATASTHQLHLVAFPIGDFFILLGIGLAALIGALIVFQKRELTY
ncbi:MAG: ABC transporter permease subunit [Candidatus Heimdallarchaeaceae archaeon]